MQLYIEWTRPIPLRDGANQNLIYVIDFAKVPEHTGVYVFGRRWGSGFEALYVGKATSLRSRVKGQFNNLRLMQHVRNAKTGKRLLFAGTLVTKSGKPMSIARNKTEKVLAIAERAFIRYFLSEGHDLVNKQGTRLRRHEIVSSGQHPKKLFPNPMYLERVKSE